MTRDEAKNKLADTWCFKEVRGAIMLREVDLIEAVRAHEAVHYPAAPNHKRALNQSPRSL